MENLLCNQTFLKIKIYFLAVFLTGAFLAGTEIVTFVTLGVGALVEGVVALSEISCSTPTTFLPEIGAFTNSIVVSRIFLGETKLNTKTKMITSKIKIITAAITKISSIKSKVKILFIQVN
jgi:hypothetical protein